MELLIKLLSSTMALNFVKIGRRVVSPQMDEVVGLRTSFFLYSCFSNSRSPQYNYRLDPYIHIKYRPTGSYQGCVCSEFHRRGTRWRVIPSSYSGYNIDVSSLNFLPNITIPLQPSRTQDSSERACIVSRDIRSERKIRRWNHSRGQIFNMYHACIGT